jgi:regulator of CtrA degradation
MKLLPERLRGLITRSRALQADIRRLDVTMHARPDIASRSNPVERQLDLLKAAFETDDL